jgi:flagellar protein FlgJ
VSAAGGQLAIDVNGLSQVKRQAKDDPRAALKSAAQQFEAIFLQMVLKSMREASPRDGMFDSEQTRLYQSLLDQQLAQTLSAKGSTGLSALVEKQLARGLSPSGIPATAAGDASRRAAPPSPWSAATAAESVVEKGTAADAGGRPIAPALSPPGGERENMVPAPAREFVSRLWPNALEASRETGIPAHFMIAQAALETGWGKSELRFADGAPTYNLFGIKAGRSWNGAVAEATTTEYVNGAAQKTVERFRAYGSYAEAFRDYANLLVSNPRYAAVINQQDAGAFARGLQQAGYATDPMYADKLARIIGGATLRAGLSG